MLFFTGLVLWVGVTATWVGIAVAVYHIAEKRLGNGASWAAVTLILGGIGLLLRSYYGLLAFGVLSLLILLLYIVRDEAVAHGRVIGDSQRVKRMMKQRLRDLEAEKPRKVPTGRDEYLVDMMERNQWQAAQSRAEECMRAAHELGDVFKEDYYRQALHKIAEKTGRKLYSPDQG